jgi:response regulator NasT
MRAILQILADVQTLTRSSGPPLCILQARTVTEIAQAASSPAAAAPPEILLFGMSRKESAAMDDLLMVSSRNPQMQIILLVGKEVEAQIGYRCRNYPVYVMTLPLRRRILTEMVRLILNMRARLMEREEELKRMRKRLNEISVTTRAKCLLIQMRQMTEDQAHYYLEKRAMDDGLTKMEVAAQIIREYT